MATPKFQVHCVKCKFNFFPSMDNPSYACPKCGHTIKQFKDPIQRFDATF